MKLTQENKQFLDTLFESKEEKKNKKEDDSPGDSDPNDKWYKLHKASMQNAKDAGKLTMATLAPLTAATHGPAAGLTVGALGGLNYGIGKLALRKKWHNS